jgi:GAF domain-containing protein
MSISARVELGRLAEQQDALQRVAALVARGASSAEVFASVALEVAQVMHLPIVGVFRYDDDGAAMTVIAAWSDRPHTLQPGTRWPLDGPSMVAEVLRTGRPARVEDYADRPGALAAAARESGLNRTAGAPIIVDDRVWGVIAIASPDAPLPDQVEDRLAEFTELLATAISNSQAREELRRLADEQAALRRVATLVAGGASSAEVFAAVAEEVAQAMHLANAAICRFEDDGAAMTVIAARDERPHGFLPGTRWPLDGPSMSVQVLRTGRPARVENYTDLPGSLAAEARASGLNRLAGAPIIVDGRVWGMIATSSRDAPLPDGIEDRLAEFTELVATAISNSEAREDLHQLAEEQTALSRVATLVAEDAPPREIFAAVCAEVAQLVHAEASALTRDEADGTVTVLGGWTSEGYEYVGNRFAVEGTVSGLVLETRRPGRIESYAEEPGSAAAAAREMGWRSSVGAPVTVEGRLWGVLAVVSTTDRALPIDTERRLAKFAELVATAIANAESSEELNRLADEQAALRRVATLVAEGARPAEVFEAVIGEVGRLGPADAAALSRYETDDSVTIIGSWSRTGGYVPVGTRHPLGQGTLGRLVSETCRPGRIDSYAEASGSLAGVVRDDMGWRSAVGAPIIVEGKLWGVVGIGSTTDRPLALDSEERLVEFTELVATAISNSQAREELTRLVEEQAALRRVATLVARGAPPAEVFEAVIVEVARLVGADAAALGRFEPDGTVTVASSWSERGPSVPVGARFPLDAGGPASVVFETRRPARVDSYDGVSGAGVAAARALGWRSSVAAPVILERDLWGIATVLSKQEKPLPLDTEERLTEFTELVATAIANAEGRAELDASRARIVATADATRRRIERDLHDGAQQQLVSLALELRAAQAMVPLELSDHRAELSRVVEGLTSVLNGLREIALGIHPASLSEGGLGSALKTLARRSPIPVELDMQVEGELAEAVEVAAYYVVSEALTNAAKYACGSIVHVEVHAQDGVLRVAVRDDGPGGADPARGTGLLGLKDRAEAIGGTMSLHSAHGAGTSLRVELPLDELNQ